MNKKRQKFFLNFKGFTVVELLVIIVVISLVFLIGGYSIVKVIDNTKQTQYKLTLFNVQKAAEAFVNEEDVVWVDNSIDDYYYQCVGIQELINLDFFNKDIIGTNVSDNRIIDGNDKVLVKKDKNSGAIISSEFLLDKNTDVCNKFENVTEIIGDGDISFVVINDDGDVNIKYSLFNVDVSSLSNYKFSYELVGKSNAFSSVFNNHEEIVNLSLTETVVVRAMIKKDDVILAEKEETIVINENVGDNIPPRIDLLPFVDYISNSSNNREVIINAYDNESGLKIGNHTINYLFSVDKINSCDELLNHEDKASLDLVVNEGNKFGDNKLKINIPDLSFSSPVKLNLYVCSKNLQDSAGNVFNGIVKDELKVYDLEQTISTALFYLPSVLSCDDDVCSLGTGGSFLANGVSLSSGTKFYYLWNQSMNLFKMASKDWPFVGAYVAFDDIKNLFSDDKMYNEALSDAQILFDDGTGTKYVFGYIPLSYMEMCLTSIPCK